MIRWHWRRTLGHLSLTCITLIDRRCVSGLVCSVPPAGIRVTAQNQLYTVLESLALLLHLRGSCNLHQQLNRARLEGRVMPRWCIDLLVVLDAGVSFASLYLPTPQTCRLVVSPYNNLTQEVTL